MHYRETGLPFHVLPQFSYMQIIIFMGHSCCQTCRQCSYSCFCMAHMAYDPGARTTVCHLQNTCSMKPKLICYLCPLGEKTHDAVWPPQWVVEMHQTKQTSGCKPLTEMPWRAVSYSNTHVHSPLPPPNSPHPTLSCKYHSNLYFLRR